MASSRIIAIRLLLATLIVLCCYRSVDAEFCKANCKTNNPCMHIEYTEESVWLQAWKKCEQSKSLCMNKCLKRKRRFIRNILKLNQ